MTWFAFSWQNFWFSFLALVFEGIPFVLLGSLISGVIAAFIPSRVITGLLPKNRLVATLVSGLLGIIFPVCECGIVSIVRRLLHKGLPLSCGVTYMLASPIVNPIVIFSTFFAFRGQAPILNTGLRVGLGYLVAVLVGLAVGFLKPSAILKKGDRSSSSQKRAGFRIAPLPDTQSGNTGTSITGKTVGATFVTFPMVARLAFLVFGPMFDLKLFFLYSVLFKKRFVIALGIGLFLLVGILCGCIVTYIYASQGL